jgi:hypothetical protein
MNREQLERLGEAGLRQMARRLGLRGALHHDRALLITGLAAYFARRPALEEEPEEEPDLELPLGATEIPPALTTETMARLLESQGQAARASALRARIAGSTDQTPTPPSVRVEQLAHGRIELPRERTTASWYGCGRRTATSPSGTSR